MLYRRNDYRNVVLSLNGGCISVILCWQLFKKTTAKCFFFSSLCDHASRSPNFKFNFYSEMKPVWNCLFWAFVTWNLILSTSSKTAAWFCKCLNCVLIFNSTSVSIQLCVSLLDRGFVLFLTCDSRNLGVAFPVAGEIYVYFWSSTVDKILKRANTTNALPVYSLSLTYAVMYAALILVSVLPLCFLVILCFLVYT